MLNLPLASGLKIQKSSFLRFLLKDNVLQVIQSSYSSDFVDIFIRELKLIFLTKI